MLAFLAAAARTHDLPDVADVAVVDDGSATMGEVPEPARAAEPALQHRRPAPSAQYRVSVEARHARVTRQDAAADPERARRSRSAASLDGRAAQPAHLRHRDRDRPPHGRRLTRCACISSTTAGRDTEGAARPAARHLSRGRGEPWPARARWRWRTARRRGRRHRVHGPAARPLRRGWTCPRRSDGRGPCCPFADIPLFVKVAVLVVLAASPRRFPRRVVGLRFLRRGAAAVLDRPGVRGARPLPGRARSGADRDPVPADPEHADPDRLRWTSRSGGELGGGDPSPRLRPAVRRARAGLRRLAGGRIGAHGSEARRDAGGGAGLHAAALVPRASRRRVSSSWCSAWSRPCNAGPGMTDSILMRSRLACLAPPSSASPCAFWAASPRMRRLAHGVSVQREALVAFGARPERPGSAGGNRAGPRPDAVPHAHGPHRPARAVSKPRASRPEEGACASAEASAPARRAGGGTGVRGCARRGAAVRIAGRDPGATEAQARQPGLSRHRAAGPSPGRRDPRSARSTADGRIEQVTVLRGLPLLDAAAVDAVKQWVYTPTLVNGVSRARDHDRDRALHAVLSGAPRGSAGRPFEADHLPAFALGKEEDRLGRGNAGPDAPGCAPRLPRRTRRPARRRRCRVAASDGDAQRPLHRPRGTRVHDVRSSTIPSRSNDFSARPDTDSARSSRGTVRATRAAAGRILTSDVPGASRRAARPGARSCCRPALTRAAATCARAEQRHHAIDGVALGDPAEVQLHARTVEADGPLPGRRAPRA